MALCQARDRDIVSHTVRIGMMQDVVMASWGMPTGETVTVTAKGKTTVWHYGVCSYVGLVQFRVVIVHDCKSLR